ncbi:MAG TPA: hypothetical protein VJ623_05730 [Holophagaceae bacterium]|nr:hypothetical protein [Holophagaceae bacterium]
MDRTLLIFLALEAPALFLFAAATQLLRDRPIADRLPKFLALAFPTLAVGAVGLPLWAAFQILGSR